MRTTGAVQSEYRELLAQNTFALLKCETCERLHFYPRAVCPFCGSAELIWSEASGQGSVYSTTVVRSRTSAHNVALIDLAEGPRMMARVDGIEPTDVVIGMSVTVRIMAEDEQPLVVFVPVGATA